MKVIPAIDLKDGCCVRLLKGDFAQSTEYSNDPAEVGRQFSALHVDDLHIVDLDGALTGTQDNRNVVASIAAESGLDVQLGGGIRSRSDISGWLAAGVTRCVIGSVAIESPNVVDRWLEEFGAEHIVLALDVRLNEAMEPILTSRGWTRLSETSLWDCLDHYVAIGARHVLCTDVSRDGAMVGPNLELYEKLLTGYPGLQLQASGGVRGIGDLQALRDIGCPAAITGRALLDGKITRAEVESFRQSA